MPANVNTFVDEFHIPADGLPAVYVHEVNGRAFEYTYLLCEETVPPFASKVIETVFPVGFSIDLVPAISRLNTCFAVEPSHVPPFGSTYNVTELCTQIA